NMECKVLKTIATKDLTDTEKGHEIFIGEVINAYVDDYYITNNIPDITKVKPFIFSIDNNYWKIGDHLGKAFSIGKNYKND
ncbi:MAG: flavin reductase family protein, partial [Candidatus Lokiarchaeota archaeon]|nr:flavin reductase family protein [Candidatus Lokiarchaeota archaeon]